MKEAELYNKLKNMYKMLGSDPVVLVIAKDMGLSNWGINKLAAEFSGGQIPIQNGVDILTRPTTFNKKVKVKYRDLLIKTAK